MMAIHESEEFKKFRITLSDLLNSENETRTKAEETYDVIPSSDKILMLMAVFSCEGIAPQDVELAAVLLRRLISSEFEEVFSKLAPEVHVQIKTQLLHHLRQNITRTLKCKVSDVTAELARKYIDDDGNNHWPEFLIFLFDSACSPDPGLREVALLMFSYVPGVFGNQQSKYIEVIHRMLTQSLTDQSSLDVRYAAIKAIASFLLVHEKEVVVQKQFSDCLNLFLQFFAQVMEDDDPRVEDLLSFLVDLVDKCPQSFRSQFDILIQLCLKCLSSTVCSEPICHLALEVVVTLSESAPAMFRKLGSKHIPSIISAIFKLMTDLQEDPEWDFDEESADEESDSNNLVGEAALDRLACALGGKTILPVVLTSLSAMLNSVDWKNRYAGLMTISAVGEGCHKQMSNILHEIVEGVLPFLLDSNSRVRYATCNALGQMATDFSPVFQIKFGDKVIVGLLQLLGEPCSPRVQAHAGAALVNFFEDCPKTVLSPHLNNIADRLEAVLSSKMNELVEKGTKMVLEQVVVTLSSLADSSEEKFLVYYDKFIPFLKYIVQNATQPELKLLRGKTIECISLIGLAVGKDKFFVDAGEVMDLLLKSQTDSPLKEDDPQLSFMIAAWTRICKILGKEFEPYLPYVMGPVLKAAAIKPEIAVLDAEDMKVIETDDDWEFVNLGEKHNFGIRTAGLEEKATACQMLVCYARELEEAFAPYVEETVKLMVPMLKFYFHDDVRLAAAEILPHLLEAAKVRGEAYGQELWKFILDPLLQALESEPEIGVLCRGLTALKDCIVVLNTQSCFSHENMLILMNLMNKKLFNHFEKANARDAQRKDDDYDEVLEETLESEYDDDYNALCRIGDIICNLFRTYKKDFFPYFDSILPLYIQLLEPNRCWSDRMFALCVFADVIRYSGPACSRYQQYFLQPLLESLTGENPDLRQIACYALGFLGQYGGPEYAKVCSECVPVLVKLINSPDSRSDDNIKATENAISAVTKFLMCNNSMINMEEMIPQWMTWLPIYVDEEESVVVYNFLCSLLETNNPLLLGIENCNLTRIVQIIAEAFYKEAIDPSSEVGKRVLSLIRDIQNNQSLFSACVGTLSADQQKALHDALLEQ